MPNDARTYKQPRRINAVSLTLLALLAAAGYVGYASWPVVSLNSEAKNIIEDALLPLYRANLLPEPDSTVGSDQVRQVLIEKLTAAGVPDPDATLTITRDARVVSIALKIATAIDLKLIKKKIPVALNPRVETNAERVKF